MSASTGAYLEKWKPIIGNRGSGGKPEIIPRLCCTFLNLLLLAFD